MKTVPSKVTSEHGNLANRGILTVKHNRIYTQKLLYLPVWICQTIYEAQVKTLASILVEWIERQEELDQLKM